jgi:hypothetical protein
MRLGLSQNLLAIYGNDIFHGVHRFIEASMTFPLTDTPPLMIMLAICLREPSPEAVSNFIIACEAIFSALFISSIDQSYSIHSKGQEKEYMHR